MDCLETIDDHFPEMMGILYSNFSEKMGLVVQKLSGPTQEVA